MKDLGPWLFGCVYLLSAVALVITGHKDAGNKRVRTAPDYWHQPVAWNNKHFYQCLDCGARFAPTDHKEGYVTCPGCGPCKGKHSSDEEDGARVQRVRRRVFCASLADVFDNEVDPAWRVDLLHLIAKTPNLDWLLLTKRIGNAHRMLDEALGEMSHGLTRWADAPWPNVWLGATVVNQEEADRDIPKLLRVPAQVRFLSIEPMLDYINLTALPLANSAARMNCLRRMSVFAPHVDWVICGGESGHAARPMNLAWVRNLRDQCAAHSTPFLFKQWGEWVGGTVEADDEFADGACVIAEGHGRTCISRAHDFGNGFAAIHVNKKRAGRLLDGAQHNDFPVTAW